MARKTECPHCLAQETKVGTTRYTKKMRLVKRYCTCLACGESFVTVEIGIARYRTLLDQVDLLNAVVKAMVAGAGAMLHLDVFKRITEAVRKENRQ